MVNSIRLGLPSNTANPLKASSSFKTNKRGSGGKISVKRGSLPIRLPSRRVSGGAIRRESDGDSVATTDTRGSFAMGASERFSKRVSGELDADLAKNFQASWRDSAVGNFQMNTLNFSGLVLHGRDAEVKDLLDTLKSLGGEDNAPNINNKLRITEKGRITECSTEKGVKEPPSAAPAIVTDEDAPAPPKARQQQQCKLISILGSTGVGKSSTARKLEAPTARAGGFFVAGKFNCQHQVPYSAFTHAFVELCNIIRNIEEDWRKEIIANIDEAVGKTNLRLLAEVIPDITKILNIDEEESKKVDVGTTDAAAGSPEKKNQLNYLVIKFIRAVCSPEHPLVLLLDDLQWADEASLDLLEAVARDTENSSLLVVTTCSTMATEKEDGCCGYLKMTNELEELNGLEKKIVLGNLHPEANTAKMKALTDILYSKTLGNAFFVIEVMRTLVNDELLKFNFGSMKWQWEDDEVSKISITGNVADLLAEKLGRMPPGEQLVLQVAACLGQSFTEAAFEFVMPKAMESEFNKPSEKNEESSTQDTTKKEESSTKDTAKNEKGSTQDTLKKFCEEGILKYENGSLFGDPSMKYSFAHNQIQDAALVSISKQVLPKLSLLLGSQLLLFGEENDELDEIVFVALDLCSKGSEFIEDLEKKVKLAGYAAFAGNKALRQGAFMSAANYMEVGLSYLGEECWANHKEMTLDLSSGLAEAYYTVGKFDEMEKHVNQILEQQGGAGEKNRAYRTLILSLGAQERFGEAIDTGLKALKGLKVIKKLSKKAGLLSALNELRKTQSLLKKNTVPLEYLPELTDKNRIYAMEIVYMMTTMMYIVNPNLFLIMYAKVVRWNIKYGVCQYSPHSFATYGVVKCGVLGDVKGGYELGEEALSLSERLGARQTESKTIFAFYAFIYHWSKYLRDAEQPLLFGYQVGLENGDVEAAFFDLGHLMMNGLIAGSVKLDTLSERMKDSSQKMKYYKQNAIRSFIVCLWQVALNLSGQSVDPFVLTGEAMNEKDMFDTIEKTKNAMLKPFLYSLKMQLLFILGDYKKALHCAKKSADYGVKISQGEPLVPRHTFFSGLTFIANGEIGRGKKVLKKMKSWVTKGNINCLHQVQLLVAELASVNGKNEVAKKSFEDAAKSAKVGSFDNDRALTHERAALHFLKSDDDTYWAAYHINLSIEAYESWSATAKVRQLVEKHQDILSKHGYNWK
ncbi:hypothetical protein ACHAXR_007176 [Thalassiosira sp. AJA248-18]